MKKIYRVVPLIGIFPIWTSLSPTELSEKYTNWFINLEDAKAYLKSIKEEK